MAQNRNSDGTFAGKNAKYKSIFDEIQKELENVKSNPLRFRIRNEISVFAYEWYLSNVKKLSRLATQNALLRNPDLQANKIVLGQIYQYIYDPLDQSKVDMFAYDTFPLVLPFQYVPRTKSGHGDGFLGLNLHYLSPRLRFFLFAKLIQIGNMSGANENKKLKLTYDLLQSATKIPEYAPCLHHYLYKNIKSNFIRIPMDEWKIAVVMPNADFHKKSEQTVWAESFRLASLHRKY